MHEMQTIVTDVRGVCLSVSLFVCLSVTNALNDPGSASLCRVIGGGTCNVHLAPCVRGHLVQPSPNAFGLLLLILIAIIKQHTTGLVMQYITNNKTRLIHDNLSY